MTSRLRRTSNRSDWVRILSAVFLCSALSLTACGSSSSTHDSDDSEEETPVEPDPDPPTLAECRAILFEQERVVAADDCLAEVIAAPASTNDLETARVLRSATRLARLIDEQVDGPDNTSSTDSVKEIMDRLGVTASGRSVFNFEADFLRTHTGKIVLPGNSPRGKELQDALAALVLPAMQASLADLRALPTGVNVILFAGDLGLREFVELDFGDVQAAIALLETALVGLNLGLAIDLDLDIDSYTPIEDTIRIQAEVLDANPQLLTAASGARARYLAARDSLRRAIDAFVLGSDSILAETDDQENEFLTIDFDNENTVLELQDDLLEIRAATERPTVVGAFRPGIIRALNGALETDFQTSGRDAGVTLDLTQLFESTQPFSPREFLPVIDFDFDEWENTIDPDTYPDKTFNGILTGVVPP